MKRCTERAVPQQGPLATENFHKSKNYAGNKGSLALFFEYLKENTQRTRAREDFATNWPLGRDYTWGRGM